MAALKQKPANAPFETVSELARVTGSAGRLRANRRQSHRALTAARHQRRHRIARRAARITQRHSSRGPYLQQRADALAAKLPVPPFPAASGFAAGAVPVWRIRAEATTPDGVTFAREAVVRPSGDARRPLLTLSWQDGTPGAAPTTVAAAPAADQPDRKLTDGRP